MGHSRRTHPTFVRENGVNHCRSLGRAGLPGYDGFLYMAPSDQCGPHRPHGPGNGGVASLPGVKTMIYENGSKILQLAGSPAYIGSFLKICIKNRRNTLGIKGCRVECRVVSGYSPGSGPAVAGSDSLPGMGQERLPRRGSRLHLGLALSLGVLGSLASPECPGLAHAATVTVDLEPLGEGRQDVAQSYT